ncbi:4Fe-4S dicluster domain-containing protein [candidate division KSB1 bacterium]|nr:4Fe-4S dicluster domain-containing protein [candidate division KSB1 bacterium]
MTKRIGILYFSPTKTTKKICQAIASGMGANEPKIFNMTLPNSRSEFITNSNQVTENIDHLIVGAPVYSGKLPLQVKECLRSLKSKITTCSAIVVYGNRDFGIALYNMVELLSGNGFRVISAGAFIGQHSYSNILPIAIGRPDESDIKKAQQFGLNTLNSNKYLQQKDVPIQIDSASKSDKYDSIKPLYLAKICIKCGKCSQVCPLALISSDSGRYRNPISKRKCIGCMACVYNCETKARILKGNIFIKLLMKLILNKAQNERREPLLIIS